MNYFSFLTVSYRIILTLAIGGGETADKHAENGSRIHDRFCNVTLVTSKIHGILARLERLEVGVKSK